MNIREAAKKRMLKHRYGLEYGRYMELYEQQGGCCAICKKPSPLGGRKGLYVDHCHKNNCVRGLLCPNCNAGIGKFFDSLESFRNAISYLANHEQSKNTLVQLTTK